MFNPSANIIIVICTRPTRLILDLLVLVHWSSDPRIDMSPHSSALPWFRAIQYLIFLLNAACLAEKQQIPIVLSLVWTHDLPQWRRARSPLCHGCGCVIDCRFTGSFSTLLVCLCDYSVSQVQKKNVVQIINFGDIYMCTTLTIFLFRFPKLLKTVLKWNYAFFKNCVPLFYHQQ